MKNAALTVQQRTILRLVADGLSDRQIAVTVRISPRTVHTHLVHLFDKTDCHNRVELTRFAISSGLVARNWQDREKID